MEAFDFLPPAERPSAPGRSEPVDHGLLLTTLAQLGRTCTEDQLLNWLAGQLLLTPDEHRLRVQLCRQLQVGTIAAQCFGSSVIAWRAKLQ